MDATEAAVHFAQALQSAGIPHAMVDVERLLALMGPALDRASVRAALVEVVGEDDYRVRKWDELVAALR